MHVDAITLATVADEWRKLLINARIDTIIQPTEHALAIQCYAPSQEGQDGQRESGQNYWLYLSAHPQMARAHLTRFKPPKIASEPPAFVMLLRKYLEGARIEAVTQPRWERVVEIVVGYHSGPASEEHVRFRLIVEIMGRMSNLIFCDEQGLILGSLKRVGADVNRYRVISAGIPYVPPPPQQRTFLGQILPRLEPTTVTAAQLSILAAEEPPTDIEQPQPAKAKGGKARKQQQGPVQISQLLTRHLLGFSPLLAREVVYRTTEQSETPAEQASDDVWEELAWNIRTLSALYDTHVWHPQLVERSETGEDKKGQITPIAYAAYVLEQYAQTPDMRVRESPSLNMLIDEFYAQAEWRDAVDGVRLPIRRVLQTQLERCKRKAELLRQEMARTEEAARYRQQAELLLAYQHEVVQGQGSVELPAFAESTDEESTTLVTVPLDPRFDAVGNANRLFNKYHKLRRATALLPAQIEQNEAELATVSQLQADLMLAENPAEITLVKAEVQAAGYIRGKSPLQDKKPKKSKGGKQAKGKPVAPGGGVPINVQSRDGFTLLIGKNSRQNEDVTFHQASTNDIWLHARGVPGSHVIIKAAGREVPHSTIEQAAQLAAYYSQARGSTSVAVDYTLQRHVRHMKGGGPGMVIYERERTVYAEPVIR